MPSSRRIARLTLNRPERAQQFQRRRCTRGARRARARWSPDGARVLVLTGAGRGFCAGQDLGDRAVAPGGDGRRSRRIDRAQLQAAGAGAARAADADDRRGERRRGRRRRQHRARLRPRDRGALGRIHPGLQPSSGSCRTPARPGSCRGWSAMRARSGSRCWASKLAGGACRGLGTHLAVRGRRGVSRQQSTPCARAGGRADARARAHAAGDARRLVAHTRRSSSTSSATSSASSATRTTMPKAWRRSRQARAAFSKGARERDGRRPSTPRTTRPPAQRTGRAGGRALYARGPRFAVSSA